MINTYKDFEAFIWNSLNINPNKIGKGNGVDYKGVLFDLIKESSCSVSMIAIIWNKEKGITISLKYELDWESDLGLESIEELKEELYSQHERHCFFKDNFSKFEYDNN